jgi:signal transduction histidine kinase
MTGKLIEAQEQERARIGRELHDDINQRLALLAVGLDKWSTSGSSSRDTSDFIVQAKHRVMEIARDVQELSHQLHSSKLEYLGLSAAAKSLCRDVSEKHNIRIDFREGGVLRPFPTEVSVTLFRVLQEALQNAIKHSETARIEVDLHGAPGDIVLKVRDYGRGFAMDADLRTKGLGLISMQERVRLLNGTISIDSKLKSGTTILARIPLAPQDNEQMSVA